ncbi:AAA-domain-containing protein [Serendipita vermifera]|nr:AAA-domain-containing protein [Serendipita vermifera]
MSSRPQYPTTFAPTSSKEINMTDLQNHLLDSAGDEAEELYVLHVEVRLKKRSTARVDFIKQVVLEHLSQDNTLFVPSVITGWESEVRLRENVERIAACETSFPGNTVEMSKTSLEIHVYQPITCEQDDLSTGESKDDVIAATVTELPCIEWDSLWDSLIYDTDVKPHLLNYLYATFLLSEANVDFNLVAWNRVVLLHGPPGTGKTSLCKALAQKLSIRLSERYTQCRLLEINSHSLFSKWFSESGKLVQKLFSAVSEMAEEEDLFLVVLIDEVESLTAARAGAMSGQEPSDALRVVNALLTQLDKMRQKKNVLFMSTSNLVGAIDPAFRDRADIVQYIGLPPKEAIYDMLHSCLMELMAKGVVEHLPIPNRQVSDSPPNRAAMAGIREWDACSLIWELADKCKGLSGRALRRLPVLAHARALAHGAPYSLSIIPDQSNENGLMNGSSSNGMNRSRAKKMGVERWISHMEAVVTQSRQQIELLN